MSLTLFHAQIPMSTPIRRFKTNESRTLLFYSSLLLVTSLLFLIYLQSIKANSIFQDSIVESIEAENSIENAIQSVGWPSQAAPLDECLSDDECGREVTPTPDMQEFRHPYMPAKSIYEKQPFIIKEIVNPQGRFADTPITFTSDHRTPPISLVKQHELKKQAALEAEQKAAMDKKALEISSFGFDSPASGRKRKRASCKDAQRILRGKATPYSYGKYTIKPEHNAFTNLGRLSRTGNPPSLRKSCKFFMRNGTYILVLHDGTEMENPDLTFLPDGFYATLYASVKELTTKTESGIKAKRGTKVFVQVDGSELKVENHDDADVAAEAEADADVEMKELGDSSLYIGTDLYEA